MVLRLVDSASWTVVRIMGLVQFVAAYTINLFYHPSPTSHDLDEREHFDLLMNAQLSGSMMFHSTSPEDFPKEIAEKALMQGRLLLGCIVIGAISGIFTRLLS